MCKFCSCFIGRFVLSARPRLAIGCLAVLYTVSPLCPPFAEAQTWRRLSNGTPFQASQPLLLTDGTVLCQEILSSAWFRLKPDEFGSYVNGTWSQAGAFQASYAPLYYASAVLADGRVVAIGGEYNFGFFAFTNQGAVYNPLTDSWKVLQPPTGWASIGDAQCAVLPNGDFILADPLSTRMAKLNPATLIWSALAGTGKADAFDEEGWTLLPNGRILTVDVIPARSEIYNPTTDSWTFAGSTINNLADPGSAEIGPAVLRPNGTVFCFGGTVHNAIYNTVTQLWSAAPDFPLNPDGDQVDMADAPACLLPNGNILAMTSPGIFNTPVSFFEVSYANNQFIKVPDTPNSPFKTSYEGRMLMLPTGQVLLTDGTSDVEIYTPTGTFNPAWRPTISSNPSVVTAGQSYSISGTQFNGLSQACTYGDDAGQATNYPLVRITNTTSGHVFYCRTFGHSTMAVATGATPVSTNFTVPKTAEGGNSTLVVVANGIPSAPVQVNVIEAPPLDSIEFEIGGLYSDIWGPAITVTPSPFTLPYVRARVNLTLPAPAGGAIVQIVSENPSLIQVNPSVTVQAGRTSEIFYIFPNPVQDTTTVLIAVTFRASTLYGAVTLLSPHPYALAVTPTSLAGGNTATGVVYIDGPAPSAGLTVDLTSSKPQYATVDTTVTVPPAKTYVTFPIKTLAVSSSQAVQITATHEGVSASATLTITPVVSAGLASLVFNPSTVAGGLALRGTITLTRPAQSGGATVALSKTDPGGGVNLPVPPSVVIPVGVQVASFYLQTNVVQVDANVTITATYGGGSKSAAVKVRAPYLISVTVLPTSIRVNTSATGRVFLSGSTNAAVTVALTYSSGVTGPASVIVPKGQTSATFVVTATATGTQTITGAYPLGTSATTPLLVFP